MKFLYDAGHISATHLDYGCGRGDDADLLFCDKFDPHWHPTEPSTTYDSISCIYVLNVIEDEAERDEAVTKILSLLNPGGKAFFAVRRDKFTPGKTSRGTWQGWIKLNAPFTVLTEDKNRYCIYELTKE